MIKFFAKDKQPILTIIVPTCDRPDTLAACLRSLAKQPNPAVEILVHDNASNEETTRVIESIADKRIIHKRLPQRVSMRENFENAVAAAKGDYLCLIGDDDAMCKGAINWIVKMLRRHKPEALQWRLAAYYWPSLSMSDIGFYWLHPDYFYGGWRWRNKKELTEKVLEGNMTSVDGSLQLYHGAVSRRLFETTKAQLGGVCFGYHIPDIYIHTAMLVSSGSNLSGDYIYVDHPLSVYGLSGHSNGTSWYVQSDKNKIDGNKSPMAQWKITAAADTSVKYSVLTPIRSLKFHDYVVLNLMVENGIVRDADIDHMHWMQTIIEETAANLWQLDGYKEAVPVRDCEKRAVKAVLEHFEDQLEVHVPAPPFRKTLYDDAWRYDQLCNVSVFPDRPDDVDTAVDTLDSVVVQRVGLLPTNVLTNRIAKKMREHLKRKIKLAFTQRPPKEQIAAP